MSTARSTMAQAVVRYLCNQFTLVEGERVPPFPDVFAIFGHGNVTCLSETLKAVRHRPPTWRGQNEQSVALAANSRDKSWTQKGRFESAKWNKALDAYRRPTSDPVPTYAQVVGVANAKTDPRELLITVAGGLPGEMMKNWQVKTPHIFDCEFGFSCMGYEVAVGGGAAMADPTRTPIVAIGDGTYIMMNPDVYSSVLAGHKLILLGSRDKVWLG